MKNRFFFHCLAVTCCLSWATRPRGGMGTKEEECEGKVPQARVEWGGRRGGRRPGYIPRTTPSFLGPWAEPSDTSGRRTRSRLCSRTENPQQRTVGGSRRHQGPGNENQLSCWRGTPGPGTHSSSGMHRGLCTAYSCQQWLIPQWAGPTGHDSHQLRVQPTETANDIRGILAQDNSRQGCVQTFYQERSGTVGRLVIWWLV